MMLLTHHQVDPALLLHAADLGGRTHLLRLPGVHRKNLHSPLGNLAITGRDELRDWRELLVEPLRAQTLDDHGTDNDVLANGAWTVLPSHLVGDPVHVSCPFLYRMVVVLEGYLRGPARLVPHRNQIGHRAKCEFATRLGFVRHGHPFQVG